MNEQCEHGAARRMYCEECNPSQPSTPVDLTPMTHVTPGMARVTDPETSKEAAESANTGALEQMVVDAIRRFPDSSIGDVVQILGVDSNCISPRFAPLRRKGRIYSTGKKISRQTGKRVLMWRAA
jgi:hypothetical protein